MSDPPEEGLDIARRFDPDLTDLLGYRIHRANLGNFEGRCPFHLLREPEQSAGAIDMLASEHHAHIEAFRTGDQLVPATG